VFGSARVPVNSSTPYSDATRVSNTALSTLRENRIKFWGQTDFVLEVDERFQVGLFDHRVTPKS